MQEFSGALVGNRKTLSIMFLDIANSTALYADSDDEDVSQAIVSLLEGATQIIKNYSGNVNQVMGDGLMAVFGLEGDYENHAFLACRAALDIMASSKALPCRIGINTGEVIVGNTPHVDLLRRIMGKTVHIAGKLEKNAIANQILISDETLQHVGSVATYISGGTMEAGNETVSYYALTGMEGLKKNEMQVTAFRGRDDELEELQSTVRVEGSASAISIITGDAGIGKSRLISEFLSHDAGHIAIDFFQFNFIPYDENIYKFYRFLLNDVIKQLGGEISLDDPSFTGVTQPGNLGIFKSALATLNSKDDTSAEWDGLDLPTKNQVVASLLCRLLAFSCRNKRVVIAVEDIHWPGSSFDGFMQEFKAHCEKTGIVLVLTDRREQRGINYRNLFQAHHRHLNPLDERDVRDILDDWLGEFIGLDPLKNEIVELTVGNPLFLREIVLSLIDDGHVSGKRGEYLPAYKERGLQLPTSLESIISTRLSRLSQLEQDTLQLASVIGFHFNVNLLKHFLPATPQLIDAVLQSLVRSELVRLVDRYTGEYKFDHALTQEAIYKSILKADRKTLHNRLFSLLIRESKGNRDILAMCAFHAYKADLFNLAYALNQHLGKLELDRSSADRALIYLGRAEKCLSVMPDISRNRRRYILCKYRQVFALTMQGRHQEAEEQHHILMQAFSGSDNADLLYKARNLKSMILWFSGELQKGIDYIQSELAGFTLQSDPYNYITNIMRIAGMLTDVGEHRLSNKDFFSIVEYFTESNASERYGILFTASSTCFAMIARNYAELGEYDQAWAYGRKAIDYAERHGTYLSLIYALVHGVMGHVNSGSYSQALPHLERAYELCGIVKTNIFYPLVATYLGYCYVGIGCEKEGFDMLKEAQAISSRQNSFVRKALLMRLQAQAYMNAGNYDAANMCAINARNMAIRYSERANKAYCDYIIGRSLSLQGSRKGASFISEAAMMAEKLDLLPLKHMMSLQNESALVS